MFRVRTILFPTDFSSYSNQAYLHAVALAEKYRATLFVVYVTSPGQDATAQPHRLGSDDGVVEALGQRQELLSVGEELVQGVREIDGEEAVE